VKATTKYTIIVILLLLSLTQALATTAPVWGDARLTYRTPIYFKLTDNITLDKDAKARFIIEDVNIVDLNLCDNFKDKAFKLFQEEYVPSRFPDANLMGRFYFVNSIDDNIIDANALTTEHADLILEFDTSPVTLKEDTDIYGLAYIYHTIDKSGCSTFEGYGSNGIAFNSYWKILNRSFPSVFSGTDWSTYESYTCGGGNCTGNRGTDWDYYLTNERVSFVSNWTSEGDYSRKLINSQWSKIFNADIGVKNGIRYKALPGGDLTGVGGFYVDQNGYAIRNSTTLCAWPTARSYYYLRTGYETGTGYVDAEPLSSVFDGSNDTTNLSKGLYNQRFKVDIPIKLAGSYQLDIDNKSYCNTSNNYGDMNSTIWIDNVIEYADTEYYKGERQEIGVPRAMISSNTFNPTYNMQLVDGIYRDHDTTFYLPFYVQEGIGETTTNMYASLALTPIDQNRESLSIPLLVNAVADYNSTDLNLVAAGLGELDGTYCPGYAGNFTNPLYCYITATFFNVDYIPEGVYYLDLNVYDYDTGKYTLFSYPHPYAYVPHDLIVNYSNYTTVSGVDYVDTLNYDVNLHCLPSDTNDTIITMFIDDAATRTWTIPKTSCTGSTPYEFSGEYKHLTTGQYNIKFEADFSGTADMNIGDHNFYSDINEVEIVSYGYDLNRGINGSLDGNIYLECYDNINPVKYDLNLNGTNYISDYNIGNSVMYADVTFTPGINTITAKCTDIVGDFETDQANFTIYSKKFLLIDEPTGNPFDLNDANSVILYIPNQQLSINLKDENITEVDIVTDQLDRLRFEFGYTDELGNETIIPRDFNLSALPSDTNIGVCGDAITNFYQHVFISGIKTKPVLIRNVYSQCFILADYTDTVYQDNFSHSAYTIAMLYNIYTSSNGNLIFLGALDGFGADETNLDVLEFKLRRYSIGFDNEGVGISLNDDGYIEIYYFNPEGDNSQVRFRIYDGSEKEYDYTETISPNEYTLLWDYESYTLDNNLLKLVVTSTKEDNSTNTITQYFTTQGATGILDPTLAILIAMILLIFAFTFVVSRVALGWFGIVIALVALGITTLAVSTWYLTFFQAILVIVIIFIGLIFKEENLGVS